MTAPLDDALGGRGVQTRAARAITWDVRRLGPHLPFPCRRSAQTAMELPVAHIASASDAYWLLFASTRSQHAVSGHHRGRCRAGPESALTPPKDNEHGSAAFCFFLYWSLYFSAFQPARFLHFRQSCVPLDTFGDPELPLKPLCSP